jgi:hypothetical protein
MRPVLFGLTALAALGCAFFIFYTVRLLIVTHFFTLTRPGGGGAYVGAIVFPLLALGFGLSMRWFWRKAKRT